MTIVETMPVVLATLPPSFAVNENDDKSTCRRTYALKESLMIHVGDLCAIFRLLLSIFD